MLRSSNAVFALAIGLLLAAIGRDALDRWVDATVLPPLISPVSTEVRDRNGALLRVYTVEDGRWRMMVEEKTVDPDFLKVLVAYEDKRFYRHNGVDLLALIRAAGQTIWHGDVVSGASTLTMQVARLLEDSGTGQLKGKLRQMRVALALERRLSKRQILQIYLERAPYGGNLEGIRAASLAWFGKEPTRLTDAEAALLVALPQAPEPRRPDRDHSAAILARDRVLYRMRSELVLSEGAVKAALTEPVPTTRKAFPKLAPHLADRARAEEPLQIHHSLTIDARLQSSLQHLAERAVAPLASDVSVAIVLADFQTGEILGSVGSAGYRADDARQGFVDMTQAMRSPGSTLKPLIYSMAFDRGLAHPQTLIQDRPVSFDGYSPQNFDGTFRGELPVAEALRQSLNIPVLLLLDEIGPAHLIDMLHRSGIETRVPGDQAGLAVGLGGLGITLEGLTQLYATLANQGQAQALHWRLGKAPQTTQKQVISRASAWHVSDILASLSPPEGAPAGKLAYKTGTSYGHRDAWAAGFDGRHVAAVWIGRPNGTPVPGAFGGELAAPILFEAFQRLSRDLTPLPSPPPETLILPTSRLPKPLQRFVGRNAVFGPVSNAPKLIFPPNGARLPLQDDQLTIKLRDGVAPFTLLANGKPMRTKVYRRETTLIGLSKGFSKVSVVDSNGRSSSVTVWLD